MKTNDQSTATNYSNSTKTKEHGAKLSLNTDPALMLSLLFNANLIAHLNLRLRNTNATETKQDSITPHEQTSWGAAEGEARFPAAS